MPAMHSRNEKPEMREVMISSDDFETMVDHIERGGEVKYFSLRHDDKGQPVLQMLHHNGTGQVIAEFDRSMFHRSDN
jgi:hypothetical protein